MTGVFYYLPSFPAYLSLNILADIQVLSTTAYHRLYFYTIKIKTVTQTDMQQNSVLIILLIMLLSSVYRFKLLYLALRELLYLLVVNLVVFH